MKAFLVDRCFSHGDPSLFGCTNYGASGPIHPRAFYLVVPDLKLSITPRSSYRISDLMFRIDEAMDPIEKWQSNPLATEVDLPLDILLCITEYVRAEKRMKKAYNLLQDTFTEAVNGFPCSKDKPSAA